MNITFKYNDKIYTTPNLEKKLKRLKISKDVIEIIENLEKPKKLIKELRHLLDHYEGIYSDGLKFYSEEINFPKYIGKYKLLKVNPFEEWAKEWYE